MSTNTQNSRVAHSQPKEVVGVDERAECIEVGEGGSLLIPPAINSGVRLINSCKGVKGKQTLSTSQQVDPVVDVQNSKLFGIREKMGLTFNLPEDTKKPIEAKLEQVEQSLLKAGGSMEGCQ